MRQRALNLLLPLVSLSSLPWIFFNPELYLTLPNTKPLPLTPLMGSWATQQRAVKGWFLKNRENHQAGRKETLTNENAILLAGWADEVASNSLEH